MQAVAYELQTLNFLWYKCYLIQIVKVQPDFTKKYTGTPERVEHADFNNYCSGLLL